MDPILAGWEDQTMSYSHYDRLTALDASFLSLEDHNVHMHVGSVGLFDAAPLIGPNGGLDMERVMATSDAALAHHPRFRQKLAWVPGVRSPVWVDDDRFNLHYHVRHTALPPPGDIRQLKRLTGRIMSQQLDRGKPLWEIWFVEGVQGGRFAVISKMHHCMIDGISGVDLLAGLMGPDRDHVVAVSGPWVPRPAPSPARLLADELVRRAALPLTMARGGQRLVSEPRRAIAAASEAIEALGEAVYAGLKPASPSPLNCEIGPHRRFDWLRVDLGAVKDIKQRLGGTLNDVVLAIVAGAMRRFLRKRGEQVEDLDFRVMVPVNVRGAAERGRLGNRVSFLLAPLPLGERGPAERLHRMVETMHGLKRSKQQLGAEVLEAVSDSVSSSLFIGFARLGARSRSYNMVVTNVPGPQFPVYLQGAPMREIYPLVPLFTNQALGIALFSYDGGLFWGFNADWDAVPDLHELVGAVEAEFGALRQVAASVPVSIETAAAGRRPTARRASAKAAAHRTRRAVARH
jgi:WS/DGAT/MGAT family acyltransferase